ncbi:MAG: tetrahydrodipicolinate N-succinyltransferase N-terminal domain-containing protein [Sulfurimonadaceae bacterium]|jgi:2,3,4,5-tetrahydropyridine-2-carboxylate N-succinyltransferase|nr:tetrahydrodipicolinate N-succinyltransferase N-terminal domain-containing protein [Sulfurimonadaceae bacterium]
MQVIQSKDEFKALVENIKINTKSYKNPLGFGICQVNLEGPNSIKNIDYLIVNWNKNFGSAAIFIQVLQEQDIVVDFTQDEVVCNVNKEFLKQSLHAFTPFLNDMDGHKNIKVIDALYTQLLDGKNRETEYRITFIFNDQLLQSTEARTLKQNALFGM